MAQEGLRRQAVAFLSPLNPSFLPHDESAAEAQQMRRRAVTGGRVAARSREGGLGSGW